MVQAMTIDARQFECFIAVAEEGHVGRAAERLHMTQPPLTRRIARLERDVGAQLFVRTPTGVELTSAGEVLLERAYRIVQVTAAAVDQVRLAHVGEAGEFVVGYFGSMIFDVIPRLLRGFLEDRPAVSLTLRRTPITEQTEAIRNGTMHLGFSRRYPDEPDLAVQDVPGEAMYAALPVGHRLLTADRLRIDDLGDERMVLFPSDPRPSFAEEITELFTDAGITPHVVHEAEDVVSALAYVSTAGLCTVVLESATSIRLPGIAFVPLPDIPRRPLKCLYHREYPPLVRAFLDHLARTDQPL
jgi:DNA-binding transcriptional LysR family regulator